VQLELNRFLCGLHPARPYVHIECQHPAVRRHHAPPSGIASDTFYFLGRVTLPVVTPVVVRVFDLVGTEVTETKAAGLIT
jgi:hypothetical protein